MLTYQIVISLSSLDFHVLGQASLAGISFFESHLISPGSIVQAPSDPPTLNRHSYCRNNPLMYTDPSGHWFFAIVLGAFIGASMSAITGGNVGMGMLTGAISGAIFFGAGELGGGILTHAIAGAATGSINAGLTGGDLGMSALIGGISASIAEAAGQGFAKLPGFKEAIKPAQDAMKFGTQTAVGAVTGGLAAELTGGTSGKARLRGPCPLLTVLHLITCSIRMDLANTPMMSVRWILLFLKVSLMQGLVILII